MGLKRIKVAVKRKAVIAGAISLAINSLPVNYTNVLSSNTVKLASADTVNSYDKVGVTYIDSISSYDTYVPRNIQYSYISSNGKTSSIVELKLESCAAIKISMNNIAAYGLSGGVKSDVPIKVNLYSDKSFVNRIQELGEASSIDDLYSTVLYLDPGTYYLKSDFLGDELTDPVIAYNIGVVAEASSSDEQSFPSTFNNPNEVELGRRFKGFISGINLIDWYRFKIKEEGLTKVSVNTLSGSMSTIITLYDSMGSKITQTDLSGSHTGIELQSYLKEGIYYISMESSSGVYGGQVSCIINNEAYKINTDQLIKVKTKEDVGVKVDYNFDVAEAIVVDRKKVKVTSSNKESNAVWSKAITDINTVEALDSKSILFKKNGTYTLLARDSSGNTVYKTIRISNIDKKAPGRPKVTKAKAGTRYVYGKGEAGSKVVIKYTVDKVGRDGVPVTRTYTYKGTVNKKKIFKVKTLKLKKGMELFITAVDNVGNVSNELVYRVK